MKGPQKVYNTAKTTTIPIITDVNDKSVNLRVNKIQRV